LLRKDDGPRTHCPDPADKLDVFDCFGKPLQTAAVLLQKSQPRAVNLAIDQETDQALVAQARGERQLSLSHIKCRPEVTEWTVMDPSHVFVGRVAHGGVITIYV